MKNVFIARHIDLHVAFFFDQRARAAGYLNCVFFTCFVFAYRAGVFAACPGSSIMTMGRSRRFTGLRPTLLRRRHLFIRSRLYCSLPAAPAADPAYPAHWQDKIPSPRRSLKPATGASANSCSRVLFLAQDHTHSLRIRNCLPLPDLIYGSSLRICAPMPLKTPSSDSHPQYLLPRGPGY